MSAIVPIARSVSPAATCKNLKSKLLSLYRGAYTGLPRNAWLLSLVQFINRSG